MKKVAILTMCLLILAGCESNAAWVIGNPESEGAVEARLGTMALDNVEVGASMYFNPYDGTGKDTYYGPLDEVGIRQVDKPDDSLYGVYALYHLPVTNDLIAYGGARVQVGEGTWDIDGTIEPLVGVTLWDFVAVEYQHNALDGEDDKILAGVRLRF